MSTASRMMEKVIHMPLFVHVFPLYSKTKMKPETKFSPNYLIFMPSNSSGDLKKKKKSLLSEAWHRFWKFYNEASINIIAHPHSQVLVTQVIECSRPCCGDQTPGLWEFPWSCIWIHYNALSLGVSVFSNNVLCSQKCPSHLPTEKKFTETFAGQCAVVLPSSGCCRNRIFKEGQSWVGGAWRKWV